MHERRGDVAPRGVRLRASVDTEAVVGELLGPPVLFGGREVAEEELFGVRGVDGDDAFLNHRYQQWRFDIRKINPWR